MLLSLYIVSPAYHAFIAKASGIVGTGEVKDGLTTIYFEGNLYGAENVVRYDQKVEHAAGRLVEKYPTTAKMMLKPEHLTQVGTYDSESHVLDVTDPDALEAWAGERIASGPTQWAQERELQERFKDHLRRGVPFSPMPTRRF